MIKPILYHSFEEKTKLEKELVSKLTSKERKQTAKIWTTLISSVKLVKGSNNRNSNPKHKTT